MSAFTAGLIGLIAIVVFTYLGFTKFANPFASPYTVHATFANANQLRPGSLVRIAGVNVGTVTSVSTVPGCTTGNTSQCSAADVTMQLSDEGLPLHKDATFAIRPRIFLEGNFFVDVRPGSPSAPIAPSGYTFAVQQGTQPVQFDQVLTSLQADTRLNLQTLLQEYGRAVKQGGPSFNSSVRYWLPAYQYTSLVEHDVLGIQPHDLSNWIAAQGIVSGALDAHPQNLQNLVTDFNRTATAFATQNMALAQAVAELPKTLAVAIPAFNALNADFCAGPQVPNCAPGPVPTLAKALTPGVENTTAMVNATLPLITQLRLLMQPSELQGLANDLSFTVPALAQLVVETIPFLQNGVRPASSCVANVVYPWSQLTLTDPHFNASNGFPPHKVYVEAVDFLPGLAGESRNFDANGLYVRVLGALGDTGITSLQSGLVGGTLAPLVGFAPKVPPGGHPPPLQPTVPCETQPPITNLSASSTAAPSPLSASTVPSSIGLIPLPLGGLPARLSADRGGKGSTSAEPKSHTGKARAARTLAAMRHELMKRGVFEMVGHPPTTTPTAAKATNAGKPTQTG